MKGLMLKDIYTLSTYKKNFLLLMGMGIVWGFASTMVSMVPAYLLMVSCSYSTGLFSYDETSKFERFAATLPISRTTAVLSRYLVTLLMMVALGGLSVAISSGIVLIKGLGAEAMLEALVTGAVMAVLALFSISILFPICYRFGAEKGRVAITISFLFVLGGFALLVFLLRDNLVAILNTHAFIIISTSIAFTLAAFALSVFLSVRFHSRKEF